MRRIICWLRGHHISREPFARQPECLTCGRCRVLLPRWVEAGDAPHLWASQYNDVRVAEGSERP